MRGGISVLSIDGEVHIDDRLDPSVYLLVQAMLNLLCAVVLGTAILVVYGKVQVNL